MTEQDLKHADLDDCRVVGVTRDPGLVVIELERSRQNIRERISVRASGVSREDAEYYVGDRVKGTHPNPQLPLDWVDFAQIGTGLLELGGLLKDEPWYVWRIVARSINIERVTNDQKAT